MKLLRNATVAAALALTFAPAAHADYASEVAYLGELSASGFLVYDTSAALVTGYRICNALNFANGEDVAQSLFLNTSWTDVSSMDGARAWVIAAVDTLCPWQYHPAPAPVPSPTFIA